MAAKFVFELEPVLEMRRRAEDESRRVVADLERERAAVEEKIRGYQRTIIATKEEIRAQLAGLPRDGNAGAAGGRVMRLADVRMGANASLHLIGRAQAAVLELAGVHKRLETARRELLRRATERKAVEMLRAKRFEEWKRRIERREQAELDELSTLKAARAAVAQSATRGDV